MKPHEFLEAVRTLRAYAIANPLPDIDDRYCISAAFAMLEKVFADAVVAEARKARGRPVVQHAILLRFPSARE